MSCMEEVIDGERPGLGLGRDWMDLLDMHLIALRLCVIHPTTLTETLTRADFCS